MSKIIAIWGSPNSGKTTISVKLAKHIYEKCGAVVTVVSADAMTPTLPVIFPNKKSEELLSLGTPLSKPDITESEVIKNIVTYKGKSNLGFLGFKDGENRFSYPTFDKAKIEAFYAILKNSVDIVIVDCTSDIQNALTVTAFKMADMVIRLCTADLKSVSFFESQLPLMSDPKYKKEEHIICLNTTDNTVFEPSTEAINYLKDVAFSFPFSVGVKNQFMKGTLLENIPDKKFDVTIKALAEKAVE